MQNKKLLVIGYVWPEPRSSAAGSHMQALLECFLQHPSEDWQITFASPAARTEHMLDLESLGIATQDITLNCSSFDDFLEQLQPDAVLFDRFMMEEQFGWRVEEHCPQALRILDTEDLFCLRHARHDHFKQHQVINPEINAELLFTELAQREVAAILRCDLSLIISEVELRILTDLFKVDPTLLVYTPFMLEPLTQAQQVALPNFQQRQHFVSIGNFRHPPNWDAVLFLKEQLWPRIRQALPKAELHIYGAYTPPKATALHNDKQGFLVKGWAESAEAVIKNAKVMLAPIRFGAGLKGKLADAMACGTPSITTSIGAEGMTEYTNGNQSWCGAIHDNTAAMADAAINLYQNPIQWSADQQQGVDIHHQRFDKSIHWQTLRNTVTDTRNKLQQHRLDNFTGAMLRHHQHKSTKYMAQWIEAKNK